MSMVIDLCCYKDKIQSILYDNGLRKYINYEEFFKLGEISDIPDLPKPTATLTIDFGDSKLTITGRAAWESVEKNE